MKLHSFLTLAAGIALTFGFSQNSVAQANKIAVVDMQEALNNYYKELLNKYPKHFQKIDKKYGISYAEAKDLVHRAVKKQVIEAERLKAAE